MSPPPPSSRHSRLYRGLHEQPIVILAAVVCCILLIITWTSSRKPAASPLTVVGPAAATLPARGASLITPAASGTPLGSAYEAAAAANITSFRNRLLSELIPTFSSKVNSTSLGFTHSDWALFSPYISCPPERPLKRYGKGEDGDKLLCAMEKLQGRGGKPCVLYSMGSAGNYLFEEAMLAATSCEIHTFDCTYDGKSLNPSRHHYHKWCIGNPGLGISTGRTFKTWDDVTQELRHDYVTLLKIDIEGHEYSVLAGFQTGVSRVLPDEISIEIHARYVRGWARTHLEGNWQNGMYLPHTQGDMGLVFMHLANQGYGVYMSDVNADWYMCCSEFSLLRIPSAAAAVGGSAAGVAHTGRSLRH